MTDVQPGAGGVGEHVQAIELWSLVVPGGARVRSFKGAVLFPGLLPPRFDALRELARVAERRYIRSTGLGLSARLLVRAHGSARWLRSALLWRGTKKAPHLRGLGVGSGEGSRA